jgi:hypothetical protein
MPADSGFMSSPAARDIRRKTQSVEHRLVLFIVLLAMTTALLVITSRIADTLAAVGTLISH